MKLIATLLLLPATLLAQVPEGVERVERVEIRAQPLKKLINFDKYKALRAQLEKARDPDIEVVMLAEPAGAAQHLYLSLNGEMSRISATGAGVLALPPLTDLLAARSVEILTTEGDQNLVVKPRLNIKVNTSEWLSAARMKTLVAKYQAAGESLYGWASFLVPKLDCLMFEYAPGTATVVASRKTADGVQALRPDERGRVRIPLESSGSEVQLEVPPLWVWGCKNSRWSEGG